MSNDTLDSRELIAIIGMACRYPGARNVDQLWRNLRGGVESVRRFSDAELVDAGFPADQLDDPRLVKAGAPLDGVDLFDAHFFGYSPREAEGLDPQQRLFLQCAWHAMEHGGYDSERFAGRVGVFAGIGLNTYVFEIASGGLQGVMALQMGNEKDYVATRTSFALDLRGPSIGVQTACSSSLVAVHLARESLLSGESDMALAGGVKVRAQQIRPYAMGVESMHSRGGHCRPFDADADGAVFSSGLGVVLLKRLDDALADGDTVHAVIRGTAVNNDGALKVGFTAPSVHGQREVIREALEEAGIDAATVSYVEAHGTGTALGDPIEIRALAEAFGPGAGPASCALGSVKSNFGHTETAAGVAGLIKTTLALKHRELPPSLHFKAPNPQIDFASTPFFVNAELRPWESPQGAPRRAGLSSFGIGGTNAHAILEEAPPAPPSGPSRPWQLLTLSARSPAALERLGAELAEHLDAHPELDFADAAHTLRIGRRAMEFRRALVCRSGEEAVAALGRASDAAAPGAAASRPPVVFLFPGQGAQRPGMGAELYREESEFRESVDRCLELLGPELGEQLRDLLLTDPETLDADQLAERATRLEATELAQPALFVAEYALARLWMAWGVTPRRMLGHSIGEWVAACLAGVFSLEDALALVALRGRMMQELEPGEMLAVLLSEDKLRPRLGDALSLAAVNGTERTVASGPPEAIDALAQDLEADGIGHRRLRTSHAFHSAMTEPLLERFAAAVAERPRHAPRMPWVSNLSGVEIRPEEAVDPRYWARHLRETVRFDRGLGSLLQAAGPAVLVEVGPGDGLRSLARRHAALREEHVLVGSLPEAPRPGAAETVEPSEQASMLAALGRAWTAGVAFDAAALVSGEERRRVPMPLYPFEERRYWIHAAASPALPARRALRDWFHRPTWRRTAAAGPRSADAHWLVATGAAVDLGAAVAEGLRAAGARVTVAPLAECGARFAELAEAGDAPTRIVYLGGVGRTAAELDASVEEGFHALLDLLRTLADKASQPSLELVLLADHLARVVDGDTVHPAKSVLFGPARVAPIELPGLRVRVVDVGDAEAEGIVAELVGAAAEPLTALRGDERFAPSWDALPLPAVEADASALREHGVYLITGGFGGLGLALAEHLARRYRARLVLVGRSPVDAAEVRRLEELGAEVLAPRADVTDPARLAEVVAEVRRQWGRIDGVVHAAGAPGGGLLVGKSREAAAAVLAPKVAGTRALFEALAGEPLDFCLLCSSTLGSLGLLGQVDYCAANAALDAFADAAPPELRAVAAAWDVWPGVGMAADFRVIDGEAAARGIGVEEGVEAFERLLAHAGPGRVIVSTTQFPPPKAPRSRAALAEADGRSPESGPATPRERHPRPALAVDYAAPRGPREVRLAEIWQEALGIERVGIHDSFFELGGDSLLLTQVRVQMREALGRDLAITLLFQHPTLAGIVAALPEGEAPSVSSASVDVPSPDVAAAAVAEIVSERPFAPRREDIAVIGMSGRFPGSRDLDELWTNLAGGVESITFFTDEELIEAGYPPGVLASSSFVKALPLLEGATDFDHTHFGIPPHEAEGIDPQHRVFLETAWEALEHAGYDPRTDGRPIGMFAGAGVSRYWLNLVSNPQVVRNLGALPLVLGNDKDYLPTRVSFKLDLQGPSVNVQAACSTSLIAVHMACRSLLDGDCAMALAGGVALAGPLPGGYTSDEGGMLSPDGHCRAFDARAHGTVFGSGSGVVVLKRLGDALADGDTIHALIKGTAINNDGSLKMGFSAPGVDGQKRVIRRALEVAGVERETVGYVEAHGTATQLGDPIEVAALNEVFGGLPQKSCPLGSIKSNIGHADAAAGVAGLLKTVLSLQHRQIPPSLHFETPNPRIDFSAGPFYVNSELADWPRGGTPRRAGVSAFGIGGSNAHVVVEEAPEREPSGPSRPWQTLRLSARTETALEAMSRRLADHLERRPETVLADAAHTLEIGRRSFPRRRVLACRDAASAVRALRGESAEGVLGPFTGVHDGESRGVVFLFPGQGAQYVDMGRDLYASEEVFRVEVDRCAELLEPHLGLDLRTLLYPAIGPDDDPDEAAEAAAGRLRETRITQPALFVVEWALARQWMAWGLEPATMLGHSIGEYVAACLAEVFSLEDALAVVAARGRLMQSAEPGAMTSVPLPLDEVEPLLAEISPEGELSLAAINAPKRLVVAGTFAAVGRLEDALRARGVEVRRLVTSHAFHSAMMDPILEDFRAELAKVDLKAPRLPFISGVSGRPITDAEARDPQYWVGQLRSPVRYTAALESACEGGGRVLLEVGPGRTLGSLAKQIPAAASLAVVYSMRHPREWASDQGYLLAARGRLWIAGCELDPAALRCGERRRRIPLPTYPFERQTFYVEMGETVNLKRSKVRKPLEDWFYVPSWKPSDLVAEPLDAERLGPCLVFADQTGLADALAPRLREQLGTVIMVRMGQGFSGGGDEYAIDPARREDYETLLRELRAAGRWPRSLVFAWGVTPPPADALAPQTPELIAARERSLERGIYSLFHLAQLFEEIGVGDPLRILVLSSEIHPVRGHERIDPEKAALIAGYMVIPQEYRNILCHGVDLELRGDWAAQETLLEQLLEELANERAELAIAYRDGRRWVEHYEAVPTAAKTRRRPHLRRRGCYWITGGLGGLGLTFARHLAEEAEARLLLTGRSALPDRAGWASHLAERGEDDSVSRKIRAVEQLEALGAEVLVMAADVADQDAMQRAATAARERFGPIHGVLHAAGLPSGSMLQTKQLEGVAETLSPKVHGTRVLESVLAGEDELELFFLFSSTGSVLGGLGYFDYCGANAFLDAFAAARTAAGKYTQSVNWGAFQEVGMATVSNLGFASEQARQAFLSGAIKPEEGVEIFRRVLERRVPRMVAWPQDLGDSLRQSRLLGGAQKTEETARESAHPRPQLSSEILAPRDEEETELLGIWRDLMGIDELGVRDDFFELGADSLLATQLLSRIRRRFEVSLSLDALYQAPTIELLAAMVRERAEGEREAVDELAALLDEVEGMSEDELEGAASELG